VKVPHFAMVNLIAGERVVPELVQQEFTAERLAAEMNKIIPDGSEREKMLEKLGEVRSQLRGGSGHLHPADRAADAVLELLSQQVYRPSRTQSFPTPTQG
jgi:lipid-A-disaccharide synthase